MVGCAVELEGDEGSWLLADDYVLRDRAVVLPRARHSMREACARSMPIQLVAVQGDGWTGIYCNQNDSWW